MPSVFNVLVKDILGGLLRKKTAFRYDSVSCLLVFEAKIRNREGAKLIGRVIFTSCSSYPSCLRGSKCFIFKGALAFLYYLIQNHFQMFFQFFAAYYAARCFFYGASFVKMQRRYGHYVELLR